jgi:hypothetical protein
MNPSVIMTRRSNVMNSIRTLFTSVLTLTLSTTLYGEKPKGSYLPVAKKQFELTYDDIKAPILPEHMFIVDFEITEEGKVENARIIEDVNLDISETVISKVMALKFKPALQNGKPVRVRYKLPIVFK